MIFHYLKTWPTPFEAIYDGRLHYTIRPFDRGFEVGDAVVLDEFDNKANKYTGRRILRTITYLNPPGQWGLRGETGVIGISVRDCPTSWRKGLQTHFDLTEALAQ